MRPARSFGAALLTGVAIAGLCGAPATADSGVTVRGDDFPASRTAQLSMVGCDSLYTRSNEPLQPYVSRGVGAPAASAMGQRSLKYDLAGGNAVGALYYVDSMLATSTASLAAAAPAGATGVAYAGYQDPRAGGSTRLWIGRAPLSGTGAWQTVDATRLSYTWTQYDMRTMRSTGAKASGPASPAAFAAANGGDGAGFYTIGFGCDGQPFHLDAWRVGKPGAVTTYDLEGLTTSTSIAGSGRQVAAGKPVTVTGALSDGAGAVVPRGTLILEARPAQGGAFSPVQVADAADGTAETTVSPVESTVYRWRFADRPLATGSTSAEFRIDVTPVKPER